MKHENSWLLCATIATVACGARSDFGGQSTGGNTSAGDAVATGNSYNTGGSTMAVGASSSVAGTPGPCTPGQTRCFSSNSVETCNLNGHYGTPVPCNGSTPICIAGSCGVCPGTGGPSMVALPLGYCIDSTEVTFRQYQDWLSTNPSPAEQVSACSWNNGFTPQPNDGWPPATSTADSPVVWVNWCDAYTYCAAVGKRLCGKIGGGANTYGDSEDVTKGQWYAACTSNGTYTYPYGEAYSATACNGSDAGYGATVPVGTMPGCQSSVTGYSGVYDMSGNVAEWQDSCEEVASGLYLCTLGGGSFLNGGANVSCGSGTALSRFFGQRDVGFRCCAP